MKFVLGTSEDGREVVNGSSLTVKAGVYTDNKDGSAFSGVALYYHKEYNFPSCIMEVINGVRHGVFAKWSNIDNFMQMATYEKGAISLSFNISIENTTPGRKEPELPAELWDDPLTWDVPMKCPTSSQEFSEVVKTFDPHTLFVYNNLAEKILGKEANKLLIRLAETSSLAINNPPPGSQDKKSFFSSIFK